MDIEWKLEYTNKQKNSEYTNKPAIRTKFRSWELCHMKPWGTSFRGGQSFQLMAARPPTPANKKKKKANKAKATKGAINSKVSSHNQRWAAWLPGI